MQTINIISQKIADLADGLLDRLTSYKLVLYFLYVLAGWTVLVGIADPKKIPYHWYDVALSFIFLVIVCRVVNYALSYALNIPKNSESDLITALILGFIMSPATNTNGYLILGLTGAFAIASKYVLTINRRHVFNPAALGAFLSGAIFHHYASWWVGTLALMPVVLVGGVLIMWKMKRFWMVAIFFLTYGFFLHARFDGAPPLHTIWLAMTATSVLFFAYIMLIEPLTSPDKLYKYLLYSVLIGVLYSVIRLGLSPEQALLIGNVFAFAVAPYRRLRLQFAGSQKDAEGIYSFWFTSMDPVKFQAGQYMEFTIPSSNSDSRGNRRYLTISSSPSENKLAFTVKIPNPTSSFKSYLKSLNTGDSMLASHLAGSFVLPKDPQKKLAFIAGGVGITPFRSIAKYMLDTEQRRDISMLYSANSPEEFAFKDLFSQARISGLKTSYATGRISDEMIKQAMPDAAERTFYVSGPYGFVKTARQSLLEMGLPRRNIISDYFPGYG